MKLPDMTRYFYCKKCANETGHWPIANGQVPNSKNKIDQQQTEYKTYKIMECKNCKSLSYCVDRHIHPGSMIGDSYIESTTYFPPLPFRKQPEWINKLKKKYKLIFTEIYQALDNKLFTIATTGVRTALDQLITEKIGDIGGFEQKLKACHKNNIITEDEKEMLIVAIDAGNASAHRGFIPSVKSINALMDITEHTFYELYFKKQKVKQLMSKAATLKKATPKRKKA
jgi:hypothetical protein